MARVVLGRILSLAEGHVGRFLNDACTKLLRVREVLIGINDRDVHLLRDLVPLRSVKWPTLPTEHDRTLSNGQLCVADHPVALGAETF